MTMNMNIVGYLSIILCFICFEGKSGQSSGNEPNINVLYPCNVSGDTRVFVDPNHAQYPQVCTYINISTVETSYTNTSGLYFISFCYNEDWGQVDNIEIFCLISGYVEYEGMPSSLYIGNEGLPKYSNLNCGGTELGIQMCGGNITTTQCDIVTELNCTRCTSYTDCLGENNSLCNSQGICECKECVNGICYVGGCLCDDLYRGDECAESICNPPCNNTGVCQTNATCSCSFPYTGVSCESSITCSPACSLGSECIVDVSQPAVYCCPGEEAGSLCQTVQSTDTTVVLTNTTTQSISNATMLATSASTSITVISSNILDPYIAYIISIVIPLLCCLVIILYLVIICVCVFAIVFMTKMKHKMDKTIESTNYGDSFAPLPDERRPTIYTAINEKTMLDYGEAPDLPPSRVESEYIDMDSVQIPSVKKTSHYEIEDEILESKTSGNIIGIIPTGSSNPEKSKILQDIPEPRDSLEFNPLYSPSHMLIGSDKFGTAQENETAYVNLVSDQ